MPKHQTPKKLWLYRVITMNDTVASINNSSCMGKRKVVLNLQDTIYSLTHYFSLSFHSTTTQKVFLKYIIAHRIIDKVTLDLLNSQLYIVKIY